MKSYPPLVECKLIINNKLKFVNIQIITNMLHIRFKGETHLNLIYRLSFYIVGLLILTFGVSLSIKADLGAGAWDALNVGLSNQVGLTIGSWVVIVGLILIFINGFLFKKIPDFLALATIVIVGSLIDFWMLVILKNVVFQGFLLQLLFLIIAIVTIALGAAIYLQPKFPLIPIDNFMMAIRFRFNVNLMMAKTIAEVFALVLALIAKGPIGIGTLIITFCIGPCIQLFFPYFENLLNKLVSKNS